MIGSWLYTLARSRLARYLLGWSFAHMSFALPLRRLRETESLVAFYHPKPSYPVHILLVPKKAVGSLADLDPADDCLREAVQTVQALVRELGLERNGYRLIVNGGAYQDVPQLHFHLVSGAGV